MRRLSRNGSQSSADRDTNSPKSPQKKRLHADESPLGERAAVPPLIRQSETVLENGKSPQKESRNLENQGSLSGPNSSCSCSDSCHASVSCSSSDDENHAESNIEPSSIVGSSSHDIPGCANNINEELRNSIDYNSVILNNSCQSHHTSSRHSSIDENSDLEPHFIPNMINDSFNLSEAENEVRKIIRQYSQVSVVDGVAVKVSASKIISYFKVHQKF